MIDGLEATATRVHDLDPRRVKEIIILKDAVATAILGARAANGVILIETIDPRPGKFSVTYSATGSLELPDTRDYDLMRAKEKLDLERAAGLGQTTGTPAIPVPPGLEEVAARELLYKQQMVSLRVNTRWLSLPTREALALDHGVRVEGGSDALHVGLDFRHGNRAGVMIGSSRARTGLGLAATYRHERLSVKNAFSYALARANYSPYGSFSTYARMNPYFAPRDPATGEYITTYIRTIGATSPEDRLNPAYEASLEGFDKGSYKEFGDNLGIDWRVTSRLRLAGQFSILYRLRDETRFVDPLSGRWHYPREEGWDFYTPPEERGTLDVTTGKEITWEGRAFLSYNNVTGPRAIAATLGVDAREERLSGESFRYTGFPSGALHEPTDAYASDPAVVVASDVSRGAGALFTANYSHGGVYLLDVTARLEGSSMASRALPSWAIGGGVNLHRLDWVKERAPFLSRLKLTAGYGVTGALPLSSLGTDPVYEQTMGVGAFASGAGTVLARAGNDGTRWERASGLNVALAAGLFGERFGATFRWYDTRRSGLIAETGAPLSSGFTSRATNGGKVGNKGYEVEARFSPVNDEKWGLTLSCSIARDASKVLELSPGMERYNREVDAFFDEYDGTGERFGMPYFKYVEGAALTSIIGMKSAGIDPTTGEELYVYPDGTESFTWDARQQQVLGDMAPRVNGSLGVNARRGRWMLHAAFSFHAGGQLYNQTLAERVENAEVFRVNADRRAARDRWQQPGDKALYRSLAGASTRTRPTSRFVEDDNEMTFHSLSLAYDVERDRLERTGLSRLGLQFNMKDILSLSSAKRERGTEYPRARSYYLTLHVGF
jgi:TonB-dependent SusC/RagA subfamily outer membrane receptor